jgi:penicillin-binding protein 1A
MRTAHQNVPVAALPGFNGGWLAGAPVAAASSDRLTPADRQVPVDRQAPVPVAANTANNNVRPEADRGLDGWFLDRLFGRR